MNIVNRESSCSTRINKKSRNSRSTLTQISTIWKPEYISPRCRHLSVKINFKSYSPINRKVNTSCNWRCRADELFRWKADLGFSNWCWPKRALDQSNQCLSELGQSRAWVENPPEKGYVVISVRFPRLIWWHSWIVHTRPCAFGRRVWYSKPNRGRTPKSNCSFSSTAGYW